MSLTEDEHPSERETKDGDEEQRSPEEVVKEAAEDVIQDYRKKVHQRGDVWIWAAGIILVAIWLYTSNC